MNYIFGDKVRIKNYLEKDKYYGNFSINSKGKMDKYFGKEATIVKVDKENESYKLDIDNREFCWTDEMLEDIPKGNVCYNSDCAINKNNQCTTINNDKIFKCYAKVGE